MNNTANNAKTTVYLDRKLANAVRIQAQENLTSVSSIINAAVRESLAEDAADIAVAEARKDEADVPFNAVVEDLQRREKI